jgi:hypothetical protein
MLEEIVLADDFKCYFIRLTILCTGREHFCVFKFVNNIGGTEWRG